MITLQDTFVAELLYGSGFAVASRLILMSCAGLEPWRVSKDPPYPASLGRTSRFDAGGVASSLENEVTRKMKIKFIFQNSSAV